MCCIYQNYLHPQTSQSLIICQPLYFILFLVNKRPNTKLFLNKRENVPEKWDKNRKDYVCKYLIIINKYLIIVHIKLYV